MRLFSTYIIWYQTCMGFVMHQNLYKRVCINDATIRDKRTGKIYIGEPEPLDKIGEVLEKILDDIGKAVDKVFGKNTKDALLSGFNTGYKTMIEGYIKIIDYGLAKKLDET